MTDRQEFEEPTSTLMFVTVPQDASQMPLHMLEPGELWWRPAAGR